MSDVAEFVASVVANPDDDLPRLIYADWLDDHGAARGKFIRQQVRHSRGEKLNLHEQNELAHAERTHGRKWAGKLAEWAFVIGYERGFPESLVLSASVFYEKASEIFRIAPIRQVTLIGARGMLRYLVQMPYLERLTALHLTGCGLGDSETEKLADCRYLGNLQTLRLGGNGLTSAGIVALSTSRRLKQLRRLDVPDNEIGDWGARILAESPNLTQLESIDLSRNDLTETGITFVRNSVALTQLRQLKVDGQRMSAAALTV